MDSLAEMHRKGLTVIVVLHDLALAAQYAQRAIILEQGKVWYDGDCQTIERQFARLQSLSQFQSSKVA